ncbi:MAG: thioether cross-link-forming SCIFF peptide maturase, partial [Intestinibacter sp.]|nr:thioether cross-link-forming SCIFF peptide maturase [Intestinibacter sp.]
MSLVHKFKQGENYFVLDVNTGSVHIVDELVYDLIDDDSLRPKEALIAEFGDKYKADIISEAYDEIKTLIDEEILYTEDPYEEI